MEIKINGLSTGYGDKMIIKNLNTIIPDGSFTMIIGQNGCGKSTLLKTLSRIIKPKSGTIFIGNNELGKIKNKSLAKKIAVLPQNPMVPEGIKVHELIAYGRFPYQKPFSGLSSKDYEIIDWAMEKTGISELKNSVLSELSGGQRQRAFIAMALAQKTDILLLDEPTTYLDIAHQLEILTLLKKLNLEENVTIIAVVHELNQACKFATNIIGMNAGKIIFEGHPMDVITKENLKLAYEIDAELYVDRKKGYPICIDYGACHE